MGKLGLQIDGIAFDHAAGIVGGADHIIDLPFEQHEELLAVMLHEFALLVAAAVFEEKRIHIAVGFLISEREVADAVLRPLVAVDEFAFVKAAEHIFRAGVLAAEKVDHFDAERRRDQIQRAQRRAGAEVFQPGDITFAQPGTGRKLIDGKLLLEAKLLDLVGDIDQIHPNHSLK